MIDLHTHTDESDGSYSPAQLVQAAVEMRLEALGICDHDTFAGYDKATPVAQAAGLELVCGIEVSTRLRRESDTRGKSVHLLGYFLHGPPSAEFCAWLEEMQRRRRERNAQMAARLAALGVDVSLEEVEALGRSVAGRPHFARLLLRKGYVTTIQKAFDVYLSESGRAYVERREPDLAEGIRRIAAAGGLPSLAHPLRLGKHAANVMDRLVGQMHELGLKGIEAYSSEHGPADVERFLSIAKHFDLALTGGSDFHGEGKPGVCLGTGKNGNLSLPRSLLDELRVRSDSWR